MDRILSKAAPSVMFLLLIAVSVNAQKRIVNGTSVDISERPYQAFIYSVNADGTTSNKGSGVIINNVWVLTAAHVVYGVDASNLRISTGSNQPLGDLNTSRVQQVIIHNDYDNDDSLSDNDIALIKLTKALTFGTNRQGIDVSQTKNYYSSVTATVSGWGLTSQEVTSFPSSLQKADVVVKSNTGNFLTSEPSSTHTYYGDSGGPLTLTSNSTDKLIGIVKGVFGTTSDHLYYYTNAGCYYDWIKENIGENTIKGSDIMGSSGTYTIDINGEYTVEVNGILNIVSNSGKRLTLSSNGNGNGNIYVYMDGDLVASRSIWVGVPIIYGVQVDGIYLRLIKYGAEQHINKTEWTIGSNVFTAYNDFIYNPYFTNSSTSQEIKVSVKATNQYGTSEPYSTTLYGSGKGTLSLSRVGSSNVFSVTSSDDGTNNVSAISYQLVNTSNGLTVGVGSVGSQDGEIDLSSVEKGLYMLKLTTYGNGSNSFKISVR